MAIRRGGSAAATSLRTGSDGQRPVPLGTRSLLSKCRESFRQGTLLTDALVKVGVIRGVHEFVGTVDAVDCDGDMAKWLLKHDGASIHKWAHYIALYERHFAPYRMGFSEDGALRPLRFLEIGVSHGGSLQLWRSYFGPDAVIFGIDIDPRCRDVGRDTEVRIGSQADPAFLRAVVAEMGGVDIVLDDGSHRGKDTRRAFEVLFPLLADGGLYVVEDLCTSYWLSYGIRRHSFIKVINEMIDGMHAWYRVRVPKRGRFAQTTVAGIHMYESVAFIAKQSHGRPTVFSVGTANW